MFKRLYNIKLAHKLTAVYLILGFATVFSVAYVSYQAFEEALLNRTYAQLTSINMLKKMQLESYFKSRTRDISFFSRELLIQQKLEHHESVSDSLLISRLVFFSKSYLDRNIILLDSNFDLVSSTEPESTAHLLSLCKEDLRFKEFLQRSKEAFNLEDMTRQTKDHHILLLAGAPVKNKEGKTIGILLAEKSAQVLTGILYERTGMGKTGETYLVGSDYRMRSRSRFFPDTNPYDLIVKTKASEAALVGKEGVELIVDYRNVPVLSAFRKLDLPGLNWAIISEIDKDEALKPIYRLQFTILIIGLLILLAFSLISWYFSRRISSPIIKLKDILLETSRGVVPREIPSSSRLDEIGLMMRATAQLIGALKRTSEFASEIGNGNFNQSYTPLSSKDILGYSLIQMRDKLKVLTENEVRLIRSNSLKLMEGQEEERKRISRELHDGIGQLLTAIRFRLGEIEGNENLKIGIRQMLDETIAETRRISNNLMPSILIDFGLEAALKKLCQQLESSSSIQVALIFQEDLDTGPLPFEVITHIYRIIQEALNNAVKYAEATEIEVAVYHSKSAVTAEIADNGKGFDSSVKSSGRGLKNMSERVSMLKGSLKINSLPGRGTVILAEIPLNE